MPAQSATYHSLISTSLENRLKSICSSSSAYPTSSAYSAASFSVAIGSKFLSYGTKAAIVEPVHAHLKIRRTRRSWCEFRKIFLWNTRYFLWVSKKNTECEKDVFQFDVTIRSAAMKSRAHLEPVFRNIAVRNCMLAVFHLKLFNIDEYFRPRWAIL